MCVHNRSLQTLSTDTHPGTMLLYHPLYDEAAYRLRDEELRNVCCGMASFCQNFFDRRPIMSSENYDPPAICTLFVLCMKFIALHT